MTLTLKEVANYLPAHRVSIAEVGNQYKVQDSDLMVFRHFFGLDRVCVAADTSMVDLMTTAACELTQLAGNTERIRYLIHARTFAASPHEMANHLAQIRTALGLQHARGLTINQYACASGVAALDRAAKLLSEDGDRYALALMVIGDKIVEAGMRMLPGVTFLGEAAAACLIELDGDHDRLVANVTRDLAKGEPQDIFAPLTRPPDEYIGTLAEVIHAALDDAAVALDELALVLPHNVNRISWLQLCDRIGYPIDRVYLDNVPALGHCFGADPFINYCSANLRGLLRTGDRYAMVSVGRDTTFSIAVFEH